MNSKLIKGILLGVAALLVCGFAVYAIFFVKRGVVETDDGTYYYDFLGNMKAGCDVPMGYDTDVNVACLGEATFGCAKGLDSVCYFTVGTGIGAGVMVGGQLLHGMLHPEAGHILLNKLP